MTTELLAVIIGAILAGIVQTAISFFDRKREAESTLTAISTEVDAICHLIRLQNYRGEARNLLVQVETGAVEEANFIIDIRSNYFSVYHALSGQLGKLKPAQVSKIVKFYSFCKAVIDATRPDGVAAELQGRINSVESLRGLIQALDEVLAYGDEIVQFPKLSLRRGEL